MNAWYDRQSTSGGYTMSLCIWFTLFFCILMGAPYWYDQENKDLFKAAEAAGHLVIREFKESFVEAERAECRAEHIRAMRKEPTKPPSRQVAKEQSTEGIGCSSSVLYDRLKEKRLIALDYIEKMKAAQDLSPRKFFYATAVICALTIFALALISTFFRRGILARFFSIFLLVLLSFAAILFAIELPHKNVKFYASVGVLFAMLLTLMDFLHRISVLPRTGSGTNPTASALERCHQKWSTLLGVALALLIAILGTVSFNIIGYETAIFGEGFIYFPLLGIVGVLTVGLAGFFWGILRNIFLILNEIEAAMV